MHFGVHHSPSELRITSHEASERSELRLTRFLSSLSSLATAVTSEATLAASCSATTSCWPARSPTSDSMARYAEWEVNLPRGGGSAGVGGGDRCGVVSCSEREGTDEADGDTACLIE